MSIEDIVKEQADKYILDKGGFTEMPKPYQEITEERFWHEVLIWGFGYYHSYRQILPDNEPSLFEEVPKSEQYMRGLHIIYYSQYAIGVLQKVEHAIPKPWKFFRIGCEHKEAKGTDTITGWHERHCPTCGIDWSWDSSG